MTLRYQSFVSESLMAVPLSSFSGKMINEDPDLKVADDLNSGWKKKLTL